MPSQVKEQAVTELTAELKTSSHVVVTEYQGLTAGEFDELRAVLRPLGAKYKVVKNRLAKIALEGAGFGDLKAHMKGPSAIAYLGTDGAAITKAMFKFGEGHPKFRLRGGRVLGTTTDLTGLRTISTLPSREVLLSTLLARMNSPLQTLLATLNEPVRSLHAALSSLAKKKEPAAAA
jgi:large subunit ribosomal protein L10